MSTPFRPRRYSLTLRSLLEFKSPQPDIALTATAPIISDSARRRATQPAEGAAQTFKGSPQQKQSRPRARHGRPARRRSARFSHRGRGCGRPVAPAPPSASPPPPLRTTGEPRCHRRHFSPARGTGRTARVSPVPTLSVLRSRLVPAAPSRDRQSRWVKASEPVGQRWCAAGTGGHGSRGDDEWCLGVLVGRVG